MSQFPRNPATRSLDPALSRGLVGYWPLDNFRGERARDLSPYRQNGSVVGSASFLNSLRGYALSTPAGVNAVEIADAAQLRIASRITISFWVYLTGYNSSGAIVIQKRHATVPDSGYNYGLSIGSDGRGLFQFYDSTYRNHYSTGTVPLNTWCHLAVTVDESATTKLRFFINGVQDSTPAYAGAMSSAGTQGLQIGNYPRFTTGAYQVNGLVQDVAIWNRALTSGEVFGLASKGLRSRASRRLGRAVGSWGAVSASASIIETSDTVAASGNIVILGAAAITEGADTASGAGVVPIIGAAAITEAGDTAAVAGVVVAVGSAGITESADTVAAIGVATVGATAAITEARDAVSASASAGSASASAAIVEGGDSVAAVGIGGQEAVIGAAGSSAANPYARWAKERRKLEKELREASGREIQELVEELEPVAPPKAKATLAELAEKAQAVRTVEARAQFQRAKAQYAKEIARLVVSAREAEEAKRRQEEDEDNWLFMLMHAA